MTAWRNARRLVAVLGICVTIGGCAASTPFDGTGVLFAQPGGFGSCLGVAIGTDHYPVSRWPADLTTVQAQDGTLVGLSRAGQIVLKPGDKVSFHGTSARPAGDGAC